MMEEVIGIVAILDVAQPRQVFPVVSQQRVGKLGVGEVLVTRLVPCPSSNVRMWASHSDAARWLAPGWAGSEVAVHSSRN